MNNYIFLTKVKKMKHDFNIMLIKSLSKMENNELEKRVLVSYQGEWYDVTDFSHPGEGAGVKLSQYNGKEVDEELETAHMTDQPQCMLSHAKKTSFNGIKYIGKLPSK